jgi:hypothetical protein
MVMTAANAGQYLVPFKQGYREAMDIIHETTAYKYHKPKIRRTPKVWKYTATPTNATAAEMEVGDLCVTNESGTKKVYVCTAIATTSGVITGSTWTQLTKSGS